MNEAIKTFKPSDGDEAFCWDYDLQEALNEAINKAIDADGLASHWLNLKVGDHHYEITHVTVDREDADTTEITIHAK